MEELAKILSGIHYLNVASSGTFSAAIRSMGMIVLNVASSGIASLLLPGGRTAHSRFCIPLQTDKTATCNIKQDSLRENLLICAKFIIWDEAPMLNKNCFEALNRTLCDIMRQEDESNMDKPFGGKVVVLGGDFRQILPVIPKGGRQDIVSATVNSSDLWKYCKVLKLTKNMRLCTTGSPELATEIKEFAD
ncbi:ATP-dependent DNA helicase RRM3-like [Lotus japonicus]|uniref:ATP-dependent DNA helicase RRM3-like n=1 Tax=Lotus japonicus TaxID=34305 RepID=UPI00258F3CA9|nr:ATP-dependent DNA helicase RRM3-like [Lotus japonicus]